eukprot:scaffold152641_cov21-Tisochrysis_lutea.AAC.2
MRQICRQRRPGITISRVEICVPHSYVRSEPPIRSCTTALGTQLRLIWSSVVISSDAPLWGALSYTEEQPSDARWATLRHTVFLKWTLVHTARFMGKWPRVLLPALGQPFPRQPAPEQPGPPHNKSSLHPLPSSGISTCVQCTCGTACK